MGKVSSYIQNMHQQFGPEWIVAQRPEDIQRNAKRIIKKKRFFGWKRHNEVFS